MSWADDEARQIAKTVDCWIYRGGEDTVAQVYAGSLHFLSQRIAALEAENAELKLLTGDQKATSRPYGEWKADAKRVAALEAEIASLKEGLRPFSDYADRLDIENPALREAPDSWPYEVGLTLGNFRRARSLLQAEEEKE